jgi:hypothetical protein
MQTVASTRNGRLHQDLGLMQPMPPCRCAIQMLLALLLRASRQLLTMSSPRIPPLPDANRLHSQRTPSTCSKQVSKLVALPGAEQISR